MGLTAGFACAFRGIGRVARRPAWWGIALAPALVTAIAVVAAFTPLSSSAKESLESALRVPADGFLRTAYDWTFGTVFVAAAVVVLYFVFAPLVRLVSAPFLAILADLAVADVSGAPTPAAPGSRIMRWLVRPLAEACAVLAVRFVWMLATSPALCIPGVGAIVWAALLTPLEGFDAIDVAISARGRVLSERIAFARRNPGVVIGIGAARTILLFIPVLNLFFLPGTVVGAVLADRDFSPDFPGRERAA